MSVCSRYCFGFALALLVGGQLESHADDTAKGRVAPVIFSAPKSDTVSSNLNQMGTKSSSLRDLESGLKKPFEIFDNGRSGGVQLPNQFTPSPSAPAINRKLKDDLDKRAEESYLFSEDNEPPVSRDGMLSSDREAVDPITGKPKTLLDRYYDRIDRSRTGPTNQPSRSLDLLADKDSAEVKGDAKTRISGGRLGGDFSSEAYGSRRSSNSVSGGGRLFSEKLKSRSGGDGFELGLGPVQPAQPSGRTKETRVDEFKRLLDGPGYGTRNGFNATPPSSPYQLPNPTIAAPGNSLSIGSQPAGGAYTTTPGFSGSVGAPVGVPEYARSAPSLAVTPVQPQQQPAQQPPVPSFKIPRGRF